MKLARIALAIGLAGLVVGSATAGEAEDAARAKAVVEAFEAADKANSRADLRAVRALGIVFDCRECSLVQIMRKPNAAIAHEAWKILKAEFYKEELGK